MAPIIREYTADAQVAGPTTTRQARPSDSGNVGNALSELAFTGQKVNDQVLKREGQAEVTDLDAKLASAHADATNDLNQRALDADPNDKNFSSDFMDSYDEKMSKISDGISTPEGREYFTKANAIMRSSFLVHSVGKQAVLAGEGAKSALQTQQDQYSASLYSDPSRLAEVKDLYSMGIEAKVENGMISDSQGDILRADGNSKLAQAAIQGFIKINPEYVKDQLKKGTWDEDLNGAQKAALDGHADTAINAKRVEQDRLRTQNQKILADQQDAAMKLGLTKMYAPEGLSTEEILDPNGDFKSLKFQQQKDLIGMVEKASTEKIKTDPNTYINTFNDIHNGKITDPDQLNHLFGRGLDMSALQQLRNEIAGKNDPVQKDANLVKTNFLSMVKHSLSKSDDLGNIKDPEGDAAYQGFLTRFLPAYTAAVKGGADPVSLVTPGRPDYMGFMIPQPRSAQQIFESQYKSSSAPLAPAQGDAPSGGVSASPLGDIGKMDLSSLNKIDPKSLTPEQRKVARDRWNELNKK